MFEIWGFVSHTQFRAQALCGSVFVGFSVYRVRGLRFRDPGLRFFATLSAPREKPVKVSSRHL